MSRVIRLQSENVLRLKAVDITPTSPVVIIGGQNGQGKTSVLQSIAMALGGTTEVPEMPVRQGEQKARIVVELDDIVVKRTFTAAGGTALVVENKEGARYPRPQDMLDKLTGKLTFDPLEFIRLKPREQMEALKKIVGLDFTALDAHRKALYDERTLVNRDADRAKAKAEFMPQHPEAPAEEQSVTDILAERDAAVDHNAKSRKLEEAAAEATGVLEDAQRGRTSLIGEIEHIEERLRSLRAQVSEYDEKIPDLKTRLAAAQESLAAFVPVDVAEINRRLATVELTNRQVRQNAARAMAFKEARTISEKAEALTSQIDEIDRQKAEQLAAAGFPVPGLGFDETGVTFNGIPFAQASGAEKLRVSLAMAAAMNPKLKVMLVRDGSLLDDASMKIISDFAAENGAQVWLERVGSNDACAVIIEDGGVAK